MEILMIVNCVRRSSVCQVLRNHLVSLASLLYSDDLALAKVAMEIVNAVGLPEKHDITMITKLCAASVILLLHSLRLTGKCVGSVHCLSLFLTRHTRTTACVA